MHSTVVQFCKQYGPCVLMKDSIQHAPRALQTLPVPPARFYSYTLDFVTGISPAQSFNCILTVICYLSKLTHLIPCTMKEDKLSATQVAKLLFESIHRFIGVLKEFIYDCDPRFTVQLWHEL